MAVEAYGIGVRGRRGVNEDAFRIVATPGYTLLVVADGLGGHGGGDVAARCCIDSVSDTFASEPTLDEDKLKHVVALADEAIAEARHALAAPERALRSTLAMLAICAGQARPVHVGDSRIYRFVGGELVARTRDHSLLALTESLPTESGFAPPDPGDRNRLLSALGAGTGVRCEIGPMVTPATGDAFLLCTDGVWSAIDDGAIADCLARATTAREWAEAIGVALDTPADDCALICAMVRADPDDEARA